MKSTSQKSSLDIEQIKQGVKEFNKYLPEWRSSVDEYKGLPALTVELAIRLIEKGKLSAKQLHYPHRVLPILVQEREDRQDQKRRASLRRVEQSKRALSRWRKWWRTLEELVWRLNGNLSHFRRSKEYQASKQTYRHILRGLVTPEGLGRREARKRLVPFAKAYLDCMHNKRGSYKHRAEAGVWAAMIRFTWRFAAEHPLNKQPPMPMPVATAFDELVYKRPKSALVLKGYFKEDGDKLTVLLEDAITGAPPLIARLIKHRLKGDDNEVARQIRIFNRDSNSGEWEINSLGTNL